MSQKIEYARFKEKGRDRIVWDSESNSLKNKHTKIIMGFDSLLRVWSKVSETVEMQDIGKYPTNPSYQKELFILIKRTATDNLTLKLLTRYFKQRLVVKSTDKNILLCVVNGSLFQTNFNMGGATQPICLNGLMNYRELFPYLKIEISEPTPINAIEVSKLIQEGYPLTEENLLNPDGSSTEFRTLV